MHSQGKPVGADTVKLAITVAFKEAMKLLAVQQSLPKKEQSSGSFHSTGADVAARQRIFDFGRKAVESALSNTELQPWEVSKKVEEAREEVMEALSRSGFFRFDVRRSLCLSLLP